VNAHQFPDVVTECQYIEQPDDFRSGTLSTVGLTTLTTKPPVINQPMMPSYKTVFDVVQISGVDVTNGYGTLYDYTKSKAGFPDLPATAPSVGLKTFAAGAHTYGYDPNQIYWAVQPCPFVKTGKAYYPYAPNPFGFGGDYLEVYNNGVLHQIVAVLGFNPTLNASFLQVWPPLPNPINGGTTNFRIVRGPRVAGTEMLQMPEFTFIDLNTNGAYNSPLPNLSKATIGATVNANDKEIGEEAIDGADLANSGNASLDILFSPSGQVITPGVATSNLNLWVRSPSEAGHLAGDPMPWLNPFHGDPTIVSVFVRTGTVGAYKPATPTAFNYTAKTYPPAAPVPFTVDPYSLIK
jgi:hypothetical protein